MSFHLTRTLAVLESTPQQLYYWLKDLPEFWTHNNEGPETWSPYDVLGHLIHGEKTDWVLRTRMILEESPDPFPTFDRFAQFKESDGKSIAQLLEEFSVLRHQNLTTLKELNLKVEDLDKKGIHPDLGEVSLRMLLATWTAHDLGHIGQIARAMAHQYKDEVGPWKAYLRILKG